MLLLHYCHTLILLSFSRCLTSRGSSSWIHSAAKIAFKPCHSLVTGVFSLFFLTVTTVTSNKIKGINSIKSIVLGCDSTTKKHRYCYIAVTHCNRKSVTVKSYCYTTVTATNN